VEAASDDQRRPIAERTAIPGESSQNEPCPITVDALVSAPQAPLTGRQRR
jgi:hypothetical protein